MQNLILLLLLWLLTLLLLEKVKGCHTELEHRHTLTSLSQALSPYVVRPLKSLKHGQCDADLRLPSHLQSVTAH